MASKFSIPLIKPAESGDLVESNVFFRPFWQKQGTVVQGTWAWAANASQTSYQTVNSSIEGAGTYNNSATHNDLDEYKWSSVYLSKGSYKITLVYIKSTDRGIAEILFGNRRLGTQDMYAAVAAYNNTATITFSLTDDTTADFRFRCNGKNASSTDNIVGFSRFQIEEVTPS